MIFEKRIEIILNILKKQRQISNKFLITNLNVSESTLRRDLDYLEKRGYIKRVHGGAILANIEFEEKSYDKNVVSNIESKIKIAKKASREIFDSKYIYLDAGTTVHQIIDYLSKDIIVVTNGIMHLEKLAKNNIKTIFLGGNIKSKTNVVIGEQALENLLKYSFDLCFIGANGYCDGEFTTHDPDEAIIKNTAIKKSKRSIILIDKSKFGKVYFSKICDIEDVDLITEDL
ncbi:DeoR/GlpR family DNA-binding transcription regulator [Anaerococcus rubeinfantis]|uniref:DeoR/GlpR family DNA-binding transcription regulator n=1 Tax=Anaerococcus rubeinfantis TaxID=1720199 RepID=UPI00073E872E|nr:DeoR/GlpR family DNA-binding transcription regulator [Anaerococcus rubeinfantis]